MGTRSTRSWLRTASSSSSRIAPSRTALAGGPRTAGWLILAASLGVGCSYTAPPEPTLEAPPEGTYFVGDTLHLVFDLPIAADSLAIRVWPETRDVEEEFEEGTEPRVDTCTEATSPCEGGTLLTVDDDRMGATIVPGGTLGMPDVPYILEVLPGLAGTDGADTGVSYYFDFQFKPGEDEVPEDPFEFSSGGYILVGVTQPPLPPTTLTLIGEVIITPEGDVRVTGGEGDEKDGFSRGSDDPNGLFVDESDQGFGIFAVGRARVTDAGERFMEIDPFDVELKIGSIGLTITQMRMTGKILDDGGVDRIEGTWSWTGAVLDNGSTDPFDFGEGSTTFTGRYVPAEDVPEGAPTVCGDNPCGAVTAQCDPPDDWPGEGICEASEDAGE